MMKHLCAGNMIKRFSIQNFKALQMKEELCFPPKLTVLIGLNGSGKSTVLQAIDFACTLARTEGLTAWLGRRGWQMNDIVTKLSGGPAPRNTPKTISFSLSVEEAEGPAYDWEAHFYTPDGRCTSELLTETGERIFKLDKRVAVYRVNGGKQERYDTHELTYTGSLLSVWAPASLRPAKEALTRCSTLDLLAPNLMKAHTRRKSVQGVGMGGEYIAPFLQSLSPADRDTFNETVRSFFPTYHGYKVRRIQGGAMVLFVEERYSDGSTYTGEATMLCDGMLRVLAIVAQCFACRGGTLLIDELEDGLNPELLAKMIEYLSTDAPCQTIITTHSPLVLSLMTIEEAEKGVYLVYKKDGISRCTPFFRLQTPASMLDTHYPGEVMLRCNLEELSREACEHE